MASFPDLRPGSRLAKAESVAVRAFRSPKLLLAVSAALLLTAFFAVSELATLRGAKAHDASAYLTRELGSPLSSAPLVREPRRGTKVTLSAQGFRVQRDGRSLDLALDGGRPGSVKTFAHGTSADARFGKVVVTVTRKKTEQYLLVDSHHGTTTWRWRLDAGGLVPRVGDDGTIGFIAGHRLLSDVLLAAPKVLDAHGRDVSPRGLRWQVTRRHGSWFLELRFDDSHLSTPYIIDPASFDVGVGTTGPTTAAASITLNVPASVKLGDLLILHVTWQGGSNVTATQHSAYGWTQLDTTRNESTNIGAQVWYKAASVADTAGGSYQWDFSPNAIATGGIAAYTGIDKSAAPQVSQLVTAPVNDTTVYYPAITPAANGAQVVSVVGWNKASSGTNLTPPLSVNGVGGAAGTNTDRWETVNSGGIASELSDFTQNTAAAVGTNGSNNLNGQGKNISHVAFRIALKADITAPTSSFALTSVSPAGSAYYPGSGTTVWYRGTGPACAAETQVAGKCSFKITNTVSDAGSGPASSQFSNLGGTTTNWTFTGSTVSAPAGGPYDSTFFAWTSGASSSPTETVTGRDNATNSDGGTTLTFTNDITGPSVPTPTVTAGYYTSATVGVSLGSVTDTGGSGVNASSLVVQRDSIGLSNGTCGVFTGSWSTVTLTGGNDTTVTNGNCYRYREVASDNVGNSTTSGISNTAKVDTQAPANSLSLTSVSGGAYKSGNTVYYRGTAAGSFKLRNAVSDSESGPASSATAALGGTTAGWTHTASTVSTPAGGPYDSNTFSWNAATSSSPTEVVTAADAAGNTTAASTLTFTDDSTAPSVIAPSVTAGYYTTLSVSVTVNTGSATDGGSGVDATTSILERDVATLTNGSCGSFSGSWTTVTLTGGNDTGVLNGRCYEYREKLSDRVGNQGTSSVSNIAKVDTQAPTNALSLTSVSGGAYKNGSTIYYRGSAAGSFKLRNAVSDSESGPASSATAALGGTTSGWTHTASTVSTPAGGPYDSNTFSWNAATSSSPTEVVTGSDAAGNTTASSTLTFTNDSTAPAVTAPSVTAGYYTSLSVPVTVNTGSATDTGGSGVDATTSILERDVATLTNGSCGSFSGSWATVTLTAGNDTGVLNGHCYEYREKLSDNVGNQGTSGTSNIAKVDNAGPTNSLSLTSVSGGAYKSGTTVYYRGSAAGSFKLRNTVTDGESGPASSATAALGGTTSGWTHTASTVNTPAGGPYDSNIFSWNASTSSAPTEVVTAADAAGNTTAASTLTFTNDSTAPAVSTPSVTAGYYTSLSVPVTVNTGSATDGGSGVDATTSILERDVATLTNGSCGSFSGSWTTVTLSGGNDTGVLNGHCYEYREKLSDRVGNQGTSGTSNIAKVDNAGPTNSLSLTSVSGGAYKSGTTIYYRGSAAGSFKLRNTVTDGESGPASSATAALGGTTSGWTHTASTVNTPAGGPYDSNTFSWNAATSSSPTEVVTAADAAGNTTAASTLTFTNDSTAPGVSAPSVTAGYYTSLSVPVTVNTGSATDGGAGVDATTSILERDVATLTNGSCGGFSGSWTTVTLSGGTDTGVLNGHCYEYRQKLSDNVGNQGTSSASNIAKVDNQGPANALTLTSITGGAYKSGTTVYYRGAAVGSFKLRNTVTDGESGPAASTTAALGGTTSGWTHTASTVNTPAGGPYDSNTFSWNASTSSSPTEVVTAADSAGNTTAALTLTFTDDSTAPSVTAPSVTAGYYTSLSVPVTVNTGSAGDGGSGVDATTSILQREPGTLSGGNCTWSGSWSTVSLTGGNDTGVASGTCYRYRELLSDRAGNQGTSSTSNVAKVDTQGPANSISLTSVSGGAYKNGTTVYYRGAAAGSFKLRNAVSDGESGAASSATAALGGTTSGWTHTASTVNTPAGGPYDSNTFSWNASTSSSPTEVVTAMDAAGNATAASTLTFTNDSTAPGVTGPGVTAGYYTSLSVPVTVNTGSATDSGSGVDATTSILERDDATLTNGTCGSFSGSWTTVTLTGGNDTGVLNGHCYEYREKLSDNVGNQGTSGASSIAKIDTSAPSTPSLAFSGLSGNAHYDGSGTLYIRPSAGGTFTATAASTDAQSGIGSYTFGTLNSNGGANFGGSQSGDHFDYTFDGTTTAPSTARTVSSTNGAGTGSANATYSIAADTTAPSVSAPSVTAGYYTSLSVPVTKSGGSDGGSGVDGTTSVLERDDATLSNGACGSFSGSWTTVTLSGGNDTSVVNGHCYEYREKLSDHVGNQGTSGGSAVAKVDTQGPANSLSLSNVSPAGSALEVGTRVYYRGSVTGGGSFKLTNAVSDGESGPASSATAAFGGTTSGWSHTPSTVSTPAGGPYDSNAFSWAQGTTSSPTEVVTAADGAGNTTAASTLTLTDDSNAPTGGVLVVNGGAAYSTTGSFPIDTRTDYSETQSATESGLASSTLTRAAASLTNDSCGTYGSPTTIVGSPAQSLPTGCYLYTLTGTDNLGNTASVTATVKVDTSDPSAPTFSFSNFTGTTSAVGNTVFFLPTSSGSFDVTASSSDGDSGIGSYAFPSAASFGSGWSVSGSGSTRTYSYTPGSATPGSQSVTATNGAGRTNSASFNVEVSDTTPPTTSIQCNAAACQGSYYTSSPVSVTLSADDGPTGSGVDVIRYTIDGSDPTPVNGSDYLGAFDIFTTTTVKFRAYDNLGNEEAVGSQLIRIDGTPPTLSLSVAEQPTSGAQHVSGTTVYYRPGSAGGTFRVTASADDPQTAIDSVDFPSIANVTGGSSQTTAPYREDYSWSAATSDSGSHDVVATNGAGATTSTGFTLTPDSTAPSGQSLTLTGAGAPYYGSSSVTFSLGDGSDGGSGLDLTSRSVTRETGTLAGNSCSGFTADAGTFSSPDTSVTGGHCYRYTFTIADNVGNVSTPVTATAKVDTQAPSVAVDVPTPLSGAGAQSYDPTSKTLFFRSTATGSFRLNSTSSDTHTAVVNVAYPDLSGVSGWSTSGTDSSWNSGAASPGSRNITATDSAGNTASDTITISDDIEAPTGQALTLTGAHAPYSNSASVSFSLTDGSDGSGSGIDTSTRMVTRETGDLAGGVCSNFSADGGTFTSPDTSVSGGHCYRYTFTIADKVGNVSSPVTATAKVDTDAPSVSVTAPVELTGAGNQYYDAASHTQYFRPSGTGSFTLTATASDNESGVAQVAFPDVSATSGWSGSTGGADTSAPYASPADYGWSSGAGAPGAVSITGTNGAAIDGSAALTIAADSAAPTGQSLTLTGADAPYYGSASVGFTLGDGSDSASGLDTSSRTVTRETGTLSGDICSGFTPDAGTFTSPDTSVTGGHCYRYSFTIADRVGNVSTPVTAVAKVDMQAPSVSVDAPLELTGAGNQYYDGATKTLYFRSTGSGSFRLQSTSSDAHTAVRSVAYPDLSGVSGWSTTGTDDTWSSGAAAPGARTVTATDKASNDGTDSITISDDTTAPAGQTITLDSAYSDGSPVTFTLGNGSDADAGIDASSATVTRETGTLSGDSCSGFSADAGTFTSPDTSVSGGHCYRYTFTIADRVGNVSTGVTAVAKVDTDDPSVSLTDPGTPLAGTVSLAASAGDASTAVTQVVFQRSPAGGSTWTTIGTDTGAPFAASWNTGGVADGIYDVRAVATDMLGHTAIDTVGNRRVDNTAPDTSIDSGPSDPSNDTTPTFAFSSSEAGSTFECRVDGGGWSACTSPHTTAALGEGSHTFEARATDQAGNTDASPASSTWTVDLTAPNTTIDTAPPALDNDATPTFTFSSTEGGSTFECRVDGGSWVPCTSPHTTAALDDGSHTFDVRATDAAGNTDTTPAAHTWSIDLGPPTVTITAPTTYINAADPSTYTVTASTPDADVTHVDFYECSNASVGCSSGTWTQFDTDNTAPYSGSWTTPGTDGKRAIRAVAVDAALNTGADVRTITIDRTAPSGVSVSYPDGYVSGSFTVTTDSGPDADVDSSTATLERQTGNLANDTCSSYSGWTTASSPDSVASGHCAVYRFRVADNAGNWSTATSGSVVKSDTNAPTSAQDDPGAILRQTVTLTSSAGDTGGSGLTSVAFQRRPAGGGSWTTISTDTSSPYGVSFDTTGVTDGLYDFRTVATDVAANTETSPAIVANSRIDNTAPSATIVDPGNPVRGTVTLTSNTSDGGSGIDTVTYELAPHGGSFNTQPASWDTTLGADGLYDLRVIATDHAGNSTTSAPITTRVDNTPPALTFSNPATGAAVSGTVSLTASSSDASPPSPPVSFFYKLHSDPPSAYTSTASSWNTTSLPGGDGLYDLRARATDDAANTTTVENTSIQVDNVPPAVAITGPAVAINGSLPSPTSFSATAGDPGGSGVQQVQFFECSNQSTDCSTGVWSPLGTVASPGPYSVSWNIPATDGNYALAAVATDNAGHSSSDIRNVSVDRTAPDTTIVGKPADPSNAATPGFTFSSTEVGSTFECRVDGGAWAPCTSPHSLSGLTDNAHTFEVRATDAAGNTDASPDTWTWHRDTNNPTATLNNPGANVRGVISLTSAENDPPSSGYASGLASTTFEYSADGTTWATIGTNSGSPFDNMVWNTAGVADGVYQLRVVAHDVAGNSTTSAVVSNVRIDNTPPTTSQDDPGQYLRGTKTLTGSAADSGSGVDHVDFQRAPAGSGSWTTIATDSTPGDGFQVSFDTASVADGHYDFRTVAYDVAGNQAASVPVTNRLVDNTPPTATLNDPGAYLRGAVSLGSSTSDPGGANASGVVGVAYEYSTNGGTTWLPTGSTFDSTSVADGNVELHVVATDAAGNTTASAPLTKLVDNTKPNTTDDAPGGWHASPVTVQLNANDGGSGVNVTEYSVDGNPTYTVGTSVVIPAPADGSNDGAHTIAYFSVDNAGNIETVKSATVLIDATAPACPSCSAADYLRGTVTLSASPAADGSGIKSVSFEYSPAGASTWTTIGTDTTGPAPYTSDWDTTAVPDGHYDLRILITDNADNVTTADLPDKVVDNTNPNVATVGAPTEGQIVGGTVGISASASDATSPIASVELFVGGTSHGTDTTAPFTFSWDTTSGPDGAATIKIVVTDMAGNSTTSAVRNVTVDNVAPTPTLADPGQNLSGTVSLSASSDPDTTQVDFERRPAGGGSWVTIASDSSPAWGTSLDTTTLADGLYDFRAVATDGTGHTGTSPIHANVRIDNTAPAGSLTAPTAGATVGGTNVTLSSSVSDGGSGVASVSYELRPTGSGAFTQIASSSTAPFSATWDATTVSTGSYDLRPIITDRAGNTFTGAAVTFDVDVTAPTVTLTSPGATIFGTVTLNATVSGSGATNVVFGATPAGGATWTSLGTDTSAPWSVSYDTTKLPDGVYDLRATVTDNLGNSSFDVVSGVRVDNAAPQVVSSSPVDGSTVGSATAISLVTSEPATPVGVTLDGGATVTPVISGTHIDYNTGALAAGPHTLAGELQDPSGKRLPFRVHFTVGSSGYVEKNTSSSGSTTVTSADGFGAATMPSGAWSTTANDWLVLRITPTAAPSGLTNGFGPGPEALDVTAYWALAGTQVHEFAQPIEVVIHSTDNGLVPATFESGAWRVIHRVPTPGVLPAGWTDGFWTAADGIHILTRHLSLFALLKDLEAPQAPQNVRGYLGPDGLTIRWLPGTDNSGTYDYVTLFAGSSDTGHFGPDYTATTVAGWTPGDPRIFRLQETDLAGNQSGLTPPLAQVPSLTGLTLDEAQAALAARGLSIGSVTVGGTGKAGTITGPEGLVLAPQGAAIDVTVAPGGAATSLVFKVVTAPRFKPAKRKLFAARVLLTRSASVTAQLYSPRRVRLYTWHFKVRAGRTILRLRIPRQVQRPGIYTLRWSARAGGETASRTIRFRLVGRKPPAQKIEIVLAGTAAKGVGGSLGKQQPTFVSSVDPAFDAVANRNRDVRVIVVDADELGVATVRDLHIVFPSTKIVALAAGPKTMAAALKAGATIVLPRSTPPATLAKIIQRLARKS